jgi:hypothetical protein
MPALSSGTCGAQKKAGRLVSGRQDLDWLRGLDLNQRPSGYEPDELPDCSTPQFDLSGKVVERQTARRQRILRVGAMAAGC